MLFIAVSLCSAVFLTNGMSMASRDEVANETNALVSWQNVYVILKDKNRPILQINSPGCLYRGRLTGLLGPSGCGKTTFLSLIAGRLSSTVVGPLRINSDVGPILSGSDVAFVYQDDSFFSMLSVLETLQLTANLRLSTQTSEERRSAISEVLQAMALTAVAGIAVGDSSGTRGISGGERKRLSVACELLCKPRLLVADEATSGLDSYQALSVVRQLKNAVVHQNIAGVLTLHQPRSSIWALLDDVVLLAANGRFVYHGTRVDAVSYFAKRGFPCPADTNPAEFLIDLVSVDYTSANATLESRERIDRLVMEFAEANQLNSSTSIFSTRKVTELKQSGGLVKEMISGRNIGHRLLMHTTRSVRRFVWLLQRAVRQTMRDNGTNLVRLGVSGILAWIVSTVYGKASPGLITEDSVGDRVTIIAQAAIQVSMLAMLKVCQVIVILAMPVNRI